MSPELARRLLPIVGGLVAAVVAMVALVTENYRLAGSAAVVLLLAIVTAFILRTQDAAERRPDDPPR